MNSLVYQHQVPPGMASRLVRLSMGILGMKRAMEKRIANNTYSKEPAKIPRSFFRRYRVEATTCLQRQLWTLSSRQGAGDRVVLYLHGGAYHANISRLHWLFVGKLLTYTNASILVPDYPLAPESNCVDVYRFLDTVYHELIRNHPNKQIVFMGDSAGGGLALGYAMKTRNEGLVQPDRIILFSPWLDASMANPGIVHVDASDHLLSVNGLKMAGKRFAGDLDVTDYRVSPIHGDFTGLGKLSIFIGTHEVFAPDARKLMHMLKDRHVAFNFFEYPGMFHDWVIVPGLREARDVMHKLADCL